MAGPTVGSAYHACKTWRGEWSLQEAKQSCENWHCDRHWWGPEEGPPSGHAVLHGLCVPDLLQRPSNMHAHMCLDWSCRRPHQLLLHVNKCMLHQPKHLADFQQKLADSQLFSHLYYPSFLAEIQVVWMKSRLSWLISQKTG